MLVRARMHVVPLFSLPVIVSFFIREPGNFSELTRLLSYIKKPWLKATLKEVNNLINNKTFLVD